MSLLSEFVRALSDDEKRKLSIMQLTSRELIVFSAVGDTDASQEQLRIKNGMSPGNWDKVQSVLLRKCYETLYPKGSANLIHQLAIKYTLRSHLQKEIEYQRRKLVPSLGSAEKIQYYQSLLGTLLSAPLVSTDEGLFKKVLVEYLAELNPLEREGERSVYLSHLHLASISRMAASMSLQKGRSDRNLEKALHKQYRAAEQIDSAKAQVFADLALSDYYAAIESPEQHFYITRALSVGSLLDSLSVLTVQQLHVKYAVSLYLVKTEFEEAWLVLSQLFVVHPALRKNIFPAAKYVQLCLITGRYADAKSMLDFSFKELLDHSKTPIAANAALAYAKYYAMVGEFEMAQKMVGKGMQVLKRKLYLQYEMEFRNLESALFVLQNQDEAALNSIERNTKYLRSKGFRTSNSDFHEFFTVMRYVIVNDSKRHGSERTVPDQIDDICVKWSQGIFNVYGCILRMVVQKRMPVDQ